jgi:uncharacterized protein YggE
MNRILAVIFGLVLSTVLLVTGCDKAVEVKQNPTIPFSPVVGAEDLDQNAGIILSQQDTGLWVNGEGKVSASPDIALLRLGVEAQKPTVAEAQNEAVSAMDKIMKVLKGKGIADKDIQTQQFNIYPVRRWIEVPDKERKEELIGYRVNNIVVVKIRKVKDTGSVIDDVVKAGGDATRIDSISFTIDDPTQLYKEARDKAVQDAMMKAEQIANVAGIALGKPIYISEGATFPPPVVRDYNEAKALGAPAPATAISPGELEYRINVRMVYAIE